MIVPQELVKTLDFLKKSIAILDPYIRELETGDKRKERLVRVKLARKNSPSYEKNRAKLNNRYKSNRVKAIGMLGSVCSTCGEGDKDILHFHHVDPSLKEFTISSRLSREWKFIEDEVRKCILLCSNCHKKIHTKNTPI